MTPYPNPMITQSDPRKPYIVISALTSLHRYHLRLYHHQQQHPISIYHAGLPSSTAYRLSTSQDF